MKFKLKRLVEIDIRYVSISVAVRYGDYIELNIDENGRITNWPKLVDVSEFFRGEDE